MADTQQQVVASMNDETIESFAVMVERAEAWAQIEQCSVAEAMRRLLRAVRTMSQIDAKVADTKSTMALMSGPMPTVKM